MVSLPKNPITTTVILAKARIHARDNVPPFEMDTGLRRYDRGG